MESDSRMGHMACGFISNVAKVVMYRTADSRRRAPWGTRDVLRCVVSLLLIGSVCSVGVGSVNAAGSAIYVPPPVVQTSWRAPNMLTKDARKRYDPVQTVSKRAFKAITTYTAAPNEETLKEYQLVRAELASLVAARAGQSRSAMLDAWKTTSMQHQLALMAGLTTLGVGYEFGSDNPRRGLDCSGLVAFAWSKAGIELPLQSKRQWQASRDVPQSEAQAGDVVWYPGHTMMYLGVGDAMLHSARPGKVASGVRIGTISWREVERVKFGNPITKQ
jgi:cell wall-associated NlpC family hydrolase